LGAIQGSDSLVGISRIRHLHKRKSARLARIAILHNGHLIDRTMLCEQLAQRVFCSLKVYVSNEKPFHRGALLMSYLSVAEIRRAGGLGGSLVFEI